MSRSFTVDDHGFEGSVLSLQIDGAIVAQLPFRSTVDAAEFGAEFVERDSERQASIARHPAGKRRLAEPV